MDQRSKRQHLLFTLRWYNLLNQFVWLSQFIVFQFATDAAPVSLETIPTILYRMLIYDENADI